MGVYILTIMGVAKLLIKVVSVPDPLTVEGLGPRLTSRQRVPDRARLQVQSHETKRVESSWNHCVIEQ